MKVNEGIKYVPISHMHMVSCLLEQSGIIKMKHFFVQLKLNMNGTLDLCYINNVNNIN